MTDIEIIFQKCKTAYYQGWKDEELAECKELLPNLSLEHLRMLNKSRWMNKKSPLYPTLFSLLYKDQLEEVVRKLNEMATEELLTELKETRSSLKKDQIAQVLSLRYDTMSEDERQKVLPILAKRGLINKTEN